LAEALTLVDHGHLDQIVPPTTLSFGLDSRQSRRLQRFSLKNGLPLVEETAQVISREGGLRNFPVDMSAMSAKRKFKEVEGGESFRVGENKVTAK
jgi:hypothetical protein